MNKSSKYSSEIKERAVRLVEEARKDYPSQWAAVESIAPKIGCAAVTLNEWVEKHEIDTGIRGDVPSAERTHQIAEQNGSYGLNLPPATGSVSWL